METKVYLCKSGDCCPAVEFLENEVHIGENENVATLTREEWNVLVEKVKSGELGKL